MGILGINFSHDGTLPFVDDGRHVFSIAEERINRTKASWISICGAKIRFRSWILDPKKWAK